MKTTAAEIRARVRGRLEGEARAEAERAAAERAKVHAARWRAIAAKHEAMGDTAGAARFRAVAEAEERGGKETDGAEASRKAGFVGNALARAAGVRLVDVAATLAGWSAERVRAVALAAVADMGKDAPEFALEAAAAAWWEARARVTVRGYMRSVGAELFGANFHDGGQRRACATSPDEYARKVQKECTGLLLEETENIFLSMKRDLENHAEESRENHERTRAEIKDRKRGRDSERAKVRAFLEMREAVQMEAESAESKGRPPRSKVALASSVVADCDLSIGVKRFLRLYDEGDKNTPSWFKLGCPDTAEGYANAKREWKNAKRSANAKRKRTPR